MAHVANSARISYITPHANITGTLEIRTGWNQVIDNQKTPSGRWHMPAR